VRRRLEQAEERRGELPASRLADLLLKHHQEVVESGREGDAAVQEIRKRGGEHALPARIRRFE